MDTLLGPIEAILNRGLRRSTSATQAATELEGRSVVVDTGRAALAVTIRVEDGHLRVSGTADEDADAMLSGGVVGLARLVGGDPQDAIRDGAAKIHGDTEIAERFQQLLAMSRPDLEEEISFLTGDVVSHQIGNAARGFAKWAQDARQSIGRSLGEFLTEESRDLPARAETERFASDVDELEAAADRAAARINALRQKIV
jgi:ubiquinone biosynthesis protein UbiJ